MAFGDREFRADTAALANVGSERESVRSAQNTSTRLEPWPTRAAIGTGRFSLKPINETPTQGLRLGLALTALLKTHARPDQRSQPMIILRPIDQADRRVTSGILESGRIPDAPVGPQIGKSSFTHGIEGEATRLERHRMSMFPGKQPPRPRWSHRRHIISPPSVIIGSLENVVLPGMVFQSETPSDGLLVERVGHFRSGRFTGFRAGFRSSHMLHTRQRQQVAQFRGLQHPGSRHRPPPSAGHLLKNHRLDTVSLDGCGDGAMTKQDRQSPIGDMRSQQGFENSQGQPGFMAQTGNPSPARINPRHGPRGGIQWKVPEKPLSDFITKLAVTSGATRLLDPRMLIGRYGLRSELPSDPQGLLRQHDPLSGAASGQCGRNTASPATHNQDRSRQRCRAAVGGTDSRNRETPTEQSHGSQERSTIHAGKLTPAVGLREPLPVVFRTQKPQVFRTSQSLGGVLQISGGGVTKFILKTSTFSHPLRAGCSVSTRKHPPIL